MLGNFFYSNPTNGNPFTTVHVRHNINSGFIFQTGDEGGLAGGIYDVQCIVKSYSMAYKIEKRLE